MKGIFPIDKFRTLQTPFYYYDTKVLRDTLSAINHEVAKYPNYSVHYAVKANANPKVLTIIRESGMGAALICGYSYKHLACVRVCKLVYQLGSRLVCACELHSRGGQLVGVLGSQQTAVVYQVHAVKRQRLVRIPGACYGIPRPHQLGYDVQTAHQQYRYQAYNYCTHNERLCAHILCECKSKDLFPASCSVISHQTHPPLQHFRPFQ